MGIERAEVRPLGAGQFGGGPELAGFAGARLALSCAPIGSPRVLGCRDNRYLSRRVPSRGASQAEKRSRDVPSPIETRRHARELSVDEDELPAVGSIGEQREPRPRRQIGGGVDGVALARLS